LVGQPEVKKPFRRQRHTLLTPWCRILFENLIVTQVVKKYPAFLWNLKVHYHVHTSPPLDPIPSILSW